MNHFNGTNIQQHKDTAVMIGNFDGLHKGHRKLAARLRSLAAEKDLQAAVFSFHPHPAFFFGKNNFRTIYTSAEKAALLAELGFDLLIEYPFDEKLAAYTPERFVAEILVKQMRCKAVVVGEGYRFGKNGAGTADALRQIGAAAGITTELVPHVKEMGEKLSSGAIRTWIGEGRMAEAAAALTRPYFAVETVVQGRQIGRTIGFPTANMIPAAEKCLPPNGVYVTETCYNGIHYKSLTNVGVSPTVTDKAQHGIETFLLDFDKEIYGEPIRVSFLRRLRGEIKFCGLDALKKQINHDMEEAEGAAVWQK